MTQYERSSLPLQVLVYFNWHFLFFYFFLNLCLFTYKAVTYYYPSNLLGWELSSVFLYFFVEYTRLQFSSKGNKLLDTGSIITALLLAVPIIVFYGYMIAGQTYVMRVDVVINAFGLVFIAFEILFLIFVFLRAIVASKKL